MTFNKFKKINMKKFLIICTALAIIACDNSNCQKENESLRKELKECKALLSELQNTPQNRLAEIESLINENNLDSAKVKLQRFSEKFPNSEEYSSAKSAVNKLEEKISSEKKEAEAKKALGFKVLKETNNIDIAGLNFKFSATNIQKRWAFDDYGNSYFYKDTQRGNSFICTKVSITSSTEKNPQLCPILAYYLKDGVLNLIGQMKYKFQRWKDYGAYLGNYSDYKNDFAYTSTIPFTCGLEFQDGFLAYPIYIVIWHSTCVERNYERFENPPIWYANNSSCNIPKVLKVEDFDFNATLVKVIKK